MNDDHEHNLDEERLAKMLASARHDAAPPDAEFLRRLREQSTAAFVAANRPTIQPTSDRRYRMWTVRGLIAASAASVLAMAFFWGPSTSNNAGRAFGEVADKIASAKTLHYNYRVEGDSDVVSNRLVWVAGPNAIRSTEVGAPSSSYLIQRGDRTWLVDETTNRAVEHKQKIVEYPVDLYGMLASPAQAEWQQFRRERPVERRLVEGKQVDVYRKRFNRDADQTEFVAFVDVESGVLQRVQAESNVQTDFGAGRFQAKSVVEILAFNQPIDEEKFKVSETLTEDGRIGKVTDAQGIVAIRPNTQERWSPVCGNLAIKPGDWLRTDVRGANAVALRLVKQTDVILGPGTLAELIKPTQVRLHSGELEIAAAEGTKIELLGPGGQSVTVAGTKRYRIDARKDEKLVAVEQSPPWLKSFKGQTANESIGSLVAKVEGRDVPLTVGYHKVSVDIRDQIARTTIEESFVNHTKSTLEGVFYFPLPQDASISGFGMWIGDNLVEADVVEKQRAREIYETILRERRDPGLLEWSGGNLFKARVFPIFGNSEKRIKITYTQVLPLKGNRYRYSYALQSELLKQHPLRELQIDVRVSSVLPLASVSSPTHSTRNDYTEHAARVEFAAQEYTPTRDFEVVMEVAGASDVVLVPHRRGDDGYFMLLLTPPAAGGLWEREVLTRNEPLDLLVLADTSGSMDAGQRVTQEAFIASLLSSLTPKDTLNLAACDVTCDWAFDKPVAAEEKNVAKAREFLTQRRSLGWSDLDRAMSAALAQAGPKTHIIYVGDGISTTGTADPQEFAKRLARLYAIKAPHNQQATLHAVSVGSTFESGTLKAIAALGSESAGGGSVRRISGEQGPRAVAFELLSEIVQPGLKDLKVEFRGLRTARVYPNQLPNIAAGGQQILLGRYLPEGRDQVGEVVVTGRQNGQEVRFATKVELKDAEQGNSFIPRLWARMHLDTLLEQGSSETIKEEVIALSEEFHIITPYTSLLVLETDADRERFKVQRRFQMRDGEKFFAQGRDDATFALAQRQMKRAGDWRLNLRRAVLAQLATAGRDPSVFQPEQYEQYEHRRRSGMASSGGIGGGGGGFFGGLAGRVGNRSRSISGPVSSSMPMDRLAAWDGELESLDSPFSLDDADVNGEFESKAEQLGLDVAERKSLDQSPEEPLVELQVGQKSMSDKRGTSPAAKSMSKEQAFDFDLKKSKFSPRGGSMLRAEAASAARSDDYFARNKRGYGWGPSYGQWLNSLFPALPPATKDAAPKYKNTWPEAARQLARELLRGEKLAAVQGGLEIARTTENFDTRWQELSSRSRQLELVSPKSWLVRGEADGSQTSVQWCNERERGVYSQAFQLGRFRDSAASDLRQPPLGLSDFSLGSIEDSYHAYLARVEPQGEGRSLLILKAPHNADYEMRFLIDTVRHVLLSIEHRSKGEVTSSTQFSEFVEVAGCWWANRVEAKDAKGRRAMLVTQTVKPLAAEAFGQQVQTELAGRANVQLIREPLPTVFEAKQALSRAGEMTFEVQLTLLLHFEQSQQWTKVLEHLEQCERLAAGKPGVRWVRMAVLQDSRRHEELRQRIVAEAAALAKPPANATLRQNEFFLASHLWNLAGVLQTNERRAMLETLKPLFERQPVHLGAVKTWRTHEVEAFEQAGQTDEAIVLLKALATDYPRDYSLQQRYAQRLADTGQHDPAFAWLDRVLAGPVEWLPHEEEYLRGTHAQLLESQGRFADLATYLAAWVKRDLESSSSYDRYLSALIRNDQIDRANELIAEWMKAGQAAGELPVPVAQRLHAAVSHTLGQGHNLYTNQVDERWHATLAETALVLARHKTLAHEAERIMSHYQFLTTDACRRVRKATAELLVKELDKLTPAEIARFVEWTLPNDPPVELPVWKQVAAGLRARWAAEEVDDATSIEQKNRLAAALVRVLSSRLTPGELLAFLRDQLRDGPAEHKAAYANELFNSLIAQPWTAEFEQEAFALLEQLSTAEEPAERLLVQVEAIYRMNDRMLEARYDAGMKAIEHQEKLTRTELRTKQQEQTKLAREGLAERLLQEAKRREGALAAWLSIERLYLETLLSRNLDQVEGACWEALGVKPPAAIDDDEATLEQALASELHRRHLITLLNLAVRKQAKPELVDRALAYLDAGLAAGGDEVHYWRTLKYGLLVALDRPAELQKALAEWIRTEDPDNRWRLSLGYLLAERGAIPEAIALFENVELADELGPVAYRTLADWYLAANRRAQHERAMIQVFGTIEEWRLNQFISQQLYPWQRHDMPLPSELDPQVLLLFSALFEKSASPQSYLYQLQQFYQATHDFRLLGVLADGMLGHSAAKVYPFLQGMQPVLAEVRDEATADSIVERLATLREKAKTPIDRRALDLLEALVERRGAELLNQPGPHVQKSLAALQRAFKGEWSDGEERLMADVLASMGRIVQAPLADEQVRQLEELYRRQQRDTFDRLHIGLRLANAHWNYDRHNRAIDLLESALKEYEQAMQGKLPTTANEAVTTLVRYLEDRGQFVRGEQFLLAQLKHPVHRQQTLWLTDRLYELYGNSVRNRGTTSLGEGVEQYRVVNRNLQAALDTDDQNHRSNLVTRLCNLYRFAREVKLPGVSEDLQAFADTRLPQVLKRQTSNYSSLVSQVAHVLHDLNGVRSGLALLIRSIEQEPAWLRYSHQDGWYQHNYLLSQWRQELKTLGELEQPLLKIVLRELRRDLETRQQHQRAIFHKHHNYFWAEKADDFARVAEEVLAERKTSSAAVQYIADYLYRGLERKTRAIEILLVAHQQEFLAEAGQSQLVDYLHRENRHGESIGILEPLVARRPDNMQYRVWLLHAYFRTNRPEQLLALLKQTDEHFHAEGRWNEAAMVALAHSCLENQLFKQSVAYYDELIPLHQRTQPNRGIGNGTLATYYAHLAEAHAGLKDTAAAVEAAGGAIVAWGPTHQSRASALATMRRVLEQSPDLDAYVAKLDKQTAETGLDNAIVRKALGQVYMTKNKLDQAIAQLKIAVELQPNDEETHQTLVTCYDRKKDAAGAIQQVIATLELQRRKIDLFQDLGRRLNEAKQPAEAERAYTSVVEALPNESESHAMLAEIRQQQNRWPEAGQQWQQVARIRALEPTGLLKLAAVQIHEKQWDEAAATVDKLQKTRWPSRFSNVENEARNLAQQITAGRGKG